jgi:hypothetical protein
MFLNNDKTISLSGLSGRWGGVAFLSAGRGPLTATAGPRACPEQRLLPGEGSIQGRSHHPEAAGMPPLPEELGNLGEVD